MNIKWIAGWLTIRLRLIPKVPYAGIDSSVPLGGNSYLQTGELVEVLPEGASPELPVYVLYPQHHQLSPRIKVFVDWLIGVYQDYFAKMPR